MKNKIFISGATGFIGSHLCETAVKKGYKVVAFDRYNSNRDLGCLKNSKYLKDIEIILGDIRDYDSVYKSMKGCKTIFHLAALIGIPYSYVSPMAYVKTNVEGTYNVLEASKNLNCKNVIITSTSEVYGSAQYIPIDEYHPINSQSPYAASKASADQLALSYYRSFNLPVKILRPFNTYGPRQSNRAIIPSIINQCLKSRDKKIILGNVNPKRDFSYVSDTCEAFFKVCNNKKSFGQIINSGTNTNISINDLAKKIFKIMKLKYKIRSTSKKMRPNLSEVNNLLCANKKIKKLTNWKPKVNIDEGLKKTIEWVKLNQSKYGDDYTL
tara:strand:+ start:3293 stop:4270 length:978 start_codon:yes stop_codon:yes gene_type:complete